MKLIDGIMHLCFVDTETSGTEPEKACILEIGAISVELDVKEKVLRPTSILNTKVKPTVPVDPGAAQVNGYKPEDWKNAPSIEEAMTEFYPLLKGKTIAGWNADFDLRFIRKAMWNLNWDWPWGTPYKTYEVSTLYADLLLTEELEYLHLNTLAAHYGYIKDGDNPHRGILDILLTIKLFERHMREKNIITNSEIDYTLLDDWVEQQQS